MEITQNHSVGSYYVKKEPPMIDLCLEKLTIILGQTSPNPNEFMWKNLAIEQNHINKKGYTGLES